MAEVHQIVKWWLIDNGYDGLINEEWECGCRLWENFMICEEVGPKCQGGYVGKDGVVYTIKEKAKDSFGEEGGEEK